MRRLAALFRRLSHRSLLIPVAIGMGVTTVAKDLRANHGATAYHYRVDLSERDEVYAAAHAVKQEVAYPGNMRLHVQRDVAYQCYCITGYTA